MTAALFDADVMKPRINRDELSQWFTPPDLAARVVRWCGDVRRFDRILEPSAGCGRLLDAVRDVTAQPQLVAHELDPAWAATLEQSFFADQRTTVVHGDYLAAPAPEARYDLCLSNPPYEGGQDGAFIEKAMDESDRVVAILRLVALAGQERYRRVWSRVGWGREWAMVSVAILVARPDFGGEHGAQADFCVVKLARRDVASPESFRGLEPTEWWR